MGFAGESFRFLVAGAEARGLPGRFLTTLRRAGAIVLKTDPVECLPSLPPCAASGMWFRTSLRPASSTRPGVRSPGAFGIDIDVFAAASVYDELRGVLRRILACGARWDEVEIITTNPALYGSALHALAVPMKVPVTFAAGLPVERTRPGRVVSGYFRWVESGYQESVIRALIEAEDIKPPKPHDWIDGPRLARALRRLRIGWGRSRYQAAIDHALGQLDLRTPERYKDDEQFVRRRNRDKQDLEACANFCSAVLEATPSGEALGSGKVSPGQIATGAKSLLERVTEGTDTDRTARRQLRRRLDRVEATLHRETDFDSASVTVQGFLKISVPPPREDGSAPWGSAPGHLYLTDIKHGGVTGRPFTFVAGLDERSLRGPSLEDPFLLGWRALAVGPGEAAACKRPGPKNRASFLPACLPACAGRSRSATPAGTLRG